MSTTSSPHGPLRVGIGGPVGSGKTALMDALCKTLRGDYQIAAITNAVPAATLYEREVNDLFGVVFEGHPKPERLVLPDDWPQGVYPLRLEEIEKKKKAQEEDENA